MTTTVKPSRNSHEIMEAVGLLSAGDKELAEIWKLTRKQAQNRARRLMGDVWVDRWLRMNQE